MTRVKNSRRRRKRADVPTLDLEPLVARTLLFLENSPRGASRVDILTAMNLQSLTWPALRAALDATGKIVVIGRGPGLRHVHMRWAEDHPNANRVPLPVNGARLNEARIALEQVLQEQTVIDSQAAQAATGLKADSVRRLLIELVNQGKVERTGQKRSTRYSWVDY